MNSVTKCFTVIGMMVLMQGSVAETNTSSTSMCIDTNGCICKEELPKLSISSPKGMSLISACNYRNTEYGIYGDFHFQGVVTVHGEVMAERIEDAGDFYSFSAKDRSKPDLFSSSIDFLRFDYDQDSIDRLKSPTLSDKKNCWSADAVLKIKRLKVVLSDQDDAGSFPEDFDLLQVGSYKKCKLK